MRRLFLLLGFVTLLGLTAWVAHYFYLRYIYVITDNAFQMADMVTVSTQDVSGVLVSMPFKESDRVKKGEVLFLVDDAVYRKDVERLAKRLSALLATKEGITVKLERLRRQLPLQVESASETLKGMKSRLKELKERKKNLLVRYRASLRKARSKLSAVEEALKTAESNLNILKSRYSRYLRLFKKKVISKEQFENVELSYKKAMSEYAEALSRKESAEQDIKLAESILYEVRALEGEIGALKREIDAFEKKVAFFRADLARVEELESSLKEVTARIGEVEKALEKARLLLSHTAVKSPIDGFIAKKWREVGDFVTPGLPVYSIYSPETFYILAWVDEDKARYVAPGDYAKVELETCPGVFEGEVESVGVSAGSVFSLIPRDTSQGEYTRVTQRVPVKLRLKGVPERCIKPGTNATVFIKR